MSLNLQTFFNDFLKESHDRQRFELPAATVKYIKNVCTHFEYPVDIEFAILETLSVYFETHFEMAYNNYKPGNPGEPRWTSFLQNLEKEVLLKTFNVVMICVKYLSRETAVPLDKILHLLNCAGYQCDVGRLKESEFEVFSILKFKITKSSLYEIVTLIGSCVEDKQDVYLKVANNCLRIVYLAMEQIRGKLSADKNDGSYFEKLLCTGVVLYSVYACNIEERLQNKVLEILTVEFELSKLDFIKISEIFKEIISEKYDNYT